MSYFGLGITTQLHFFPDRGRSREARLDEKLLSSFVPPRFELVTSQAKHQLDDHHANVHHLFHNCYTNLNT
jgi:hypothetical protein